MSLFCYALRVHYCYAITLKRKRNLVALLLLSYRCIVTINVLRLFLTVPWVGLQCVIVVFSDILTYFWIQIKTYVHLCKGFIVCVYRVVVSRSPLLTRETHKRVIVQIVKTQMKNSMMLHFIWVCTYFFVWVSTSSQG